MLQHDGLKDNLCTCFLFLRPTLMTRTLMERWQDNIVLTREKVNQVSAVGQPASIRNL